MRNIKFIFLIFFLFLFSNSYGAEKQKLSVQEVYELQERCGKSAAEFFKKKYGTDLDYAGSGTTHHYNCHYNQKLNKCFILITGTFNRTKDAEEKISMMIELYDVQENALYGLFSTLPEKLSCTFLGVDCPSKTVWDKLIAPFMTE